MKLETTALDKEDWADEILDLAAAKKAAKNGQPAPPPRPRHRKPSEPSIPTIGSSRERQQGRAPAPPRG